MTRAHPHHRERLRLALGDWREGFGMLDALLLDRTVPSDQVEAMQLSQRLRMAAAQARDIAAELDREAGRLDCWAEVEECRLAEDDSAAEGGTTGQHEARVLRYALKLREAMGSDDIPRVTAPSNRVHLALCDLCCAVDDDEEYFQDRAKEAAEEAKGGDTP